MPLSDADLEKLDRRLQAALSRPLTPDELARGRALVERTRREQDPSATSVVSAHPKG